MKKSISNLFLFMGLLLVSLQGNAQLLSDFSQQTLTSKAWGNGTLPVGDIPTGWIQASLDGLTPISAINQVFSTTTGWVTAEVSFSSGRKDTLAMSNSAYNPTGTSNDVMISTPIVVPNNPNVYLTWEALSPLWAFSNPSYGASYSVYLSSTANPASPSNLVYTTATEKYYLVEHAVNISQYGGTTVYVTFVNNSNNKNFLLVDDIQFQIFDQPDVELYSTKLNAINKTGSSINISGTIYNKNEPVNSLEITWTDATGPHVDNITGISIPPLGTYAFNHSVPVTSSVEEAKDITVTVSKVNNKSDIDPSDNSFNGKAYFINNGPARVPVIEEGTGTWCGWCPRGTVAMDYMYKTYSDFVGIAVHNGDPMAVAEYDAGARFSSFPGFNADRYVLGASVSQTDFENTYKSRKTVPTIVDLSSSTVNISGTTVTSNVDATFSMDVADDIRFAAIIVENKVTGTDPGYAQENYYAGGGSGPMGGYENKPKTVPAADMVYDHVGRILEGGYNGLVGSVPSSVTKGQKVQYTFNTQLPGTINPQNVDVVIVAILGRTGEILNAYSSHKPDAIKTAAIDEIKLKLFPNPTSQNFINVSYEMDDDAMITIYDIQGKVLQQTEVKNTGTTVTKQLDVTSLSTGTYMISVSNSKASYSQFFTKN